MIKTKLSILAIIFLLSCCQSATVQLIVQKPLDYTNLDTILGLIDQRTFNLPPPAPSPSCRFPIPPIRKLLRLAFHDCNGQDCDASINYLNADNAGLTQTVDYLNCQYTAGPNNVIYQTYLSRSDFFVLHYLRALAKGILNGNPGLTKVPYPLGTSVYFSGRRDNPAITYKNDNKEGVFPDGRAVWSVILAALGTGTGGLGLTENDIIVLLGTHGSGRATAANSQFVGPWGAPTDQNQVNNNFFINLMASKNSAFTFVQQTPSTKVQWVGLPPGTPGNPGNPGNPSRLMLNADMQIVYNFTTDANGIALAPNVFCSQYGNTGSTFKDCRQTNSRYMFPSKNANLAYTYSKNNAQFLADLVISYKKLASFSQATALAGGFIPFTPKKKVCVGTVCTCSGDVLLSGC